MVDSIDLSTNAYVRYPRPVPPPPRLSSPDYAQKDSYLNNIVDIKNPLLNTLTLKNKLDQKEQSYYEILINRLEFNNNEYVSKVLSDRIPANKILDSNNLPNVCSSVEKIVTSSTHSFSTNAIEPPIVPPPPLLSSFASDGIDVTNINNNMCSLTDISPPIPEPPKRTHAHYLEPILESLEFEKNF